MSLIECPHHNKRETTVFGQERRSYKCQTCGDEIVGDLVTLCEHRAIIKRSTFPGDKRPVSGDGGWVCCACPAHIRIEVVGVVGVM